MITDRQVRLLRQKRMEGKTQETAAAKAGMSVRSARKWQSGPLPSQAKPEHRWRTRPDPFDGVWEDEIEPLLRNDPTGKLKATAIIAQLTGVRTQNARTTDVPSASRMPTTDPSTCPTLRMTGVGIECFGSAVCLMQVLRHNRVFKFAGFRRPV